MTPWPPVIYRRDDLGDLTKSADDLAPLLLPIIDDNELLTILIDVLLEPNARRLLTVFSFAFKTRLEWGGRITAGQVDEFAKIYEDQEPWKDL